MVSWQDIDLYKRKCYHNKGVALDFCCAKIYA